MKLSTRARYALRAMIHIARNDNEGQPINLSEIAGKTGISRRYLEQIIIPLRNAGMVTGMSGKKGGYVLAKRAEEISAGDIVQTAIGPINIVNCANKPETCEKADLCECRPLYMMINEKIVAALNKFSLSDLADPKRTEMICNELKSHK